MLDFFTGSERRWNVLENENNPMNNYEDLIKQLLFLRGISPDKEHLFLHPSLDQLHSPFLLEGMQNAVSRIIQAMERKEPILIYGDYDVDGTTSVAILKNFFQDLNVEVDFYIPDRIDEGYGISDLAVEKIINNQTQLMITVDCGITARKQVEDMQEGRRIKGLPIDIIITDHHQVDPEKLPTTFSCINPHQPDSNYPFKNLCGAGIAWKLVYAIADTLDRKELAMKYIDLAAFATIADIVDLKDENRVIAHFGIEKMNTSPQPGLAALMAVAGNKTNVVDSMKIGYQLSPRVNAAGRMGDANIAVSLLTSRTLADANQFAELLHETNKERQKIQEEIYIQAIAVIEARAEYRNEPVLVVWGNHWHHGVIGIVASKLVDYYHKPVFVLAVVNGEAVGSGRSIAGYDLFEAMSEHKYLLTRFGGHAQAGGLTLESDLLETFRKDVNEQAKSMITEEMKIKEVRVDAVLGENVIQIDTVRLLQALEPTGQGNKKPLFLIEDAEIVEVRTLTEGRHLKLSIRKDSTTLACIGFGLGKMEQYLENQQKIDILGYLNLNEWNGRDTIQLQIEDIRLPKKACICNELMLAAVQRFELLDCDTEWLYNEVTRLCFPTSLFQLTRDDLASLYQFIRTKNMPNTKLEDLFLLSTKIKNKENHKIGFFKLMIGLMIFDELGLYSCSIQNDGLYKLSSVIVEGKVELEDSELYQTIAATFT